LGITDCELGELQKSGIAQLQNYTIAEFNDLRRNSGPNEREHMQKAHNLSRNDALSDYFIRLSG